MTKKIALVIAPFRNATEMEKGATLAAVNKLLTMGYVPVFLPWALERSLSDHDPEQRPIALNCSWDFTQFIARGGGKAFVVRGRISGGMQKDIEAWRMASGPEPEVI